MSKAQLVITVVVLEGRSKSEVARDYNVSRYWVQQLVKRYETEGAAAFEPHSRRPHRNPRAVGADLEDKVVRLRKTLDKAGYDAGAATIAEHLTRDPSITKIPAVATIWRILTRRGFVTPQPQKRPRSSWKRFETDLPNQCWQADVTHWRLADTTEVEILNIIDDHSQLAIASHARPVTTGPDVVDTITAAFTDWGTPATMLTGRTALQILLGELGIKYINSRPYHPQTCGKVERFHKPSRSASPPCHQQPPSPNYKTRSTISAITTTPPGPTEPCTDAAPCRPSPTDPKPSPPDARSRRTTASATTASTPPEYSPSATTPAYTTSA
jgi:transposase InsO family protein